MNEEKTLWQSKTNTIEIVINASGIVISISLLIFIFFKITQFLFLAFPNLDEITRMLAAEKYFWVDFPSTLIALLFSLYIIYKYFWDSIVALTLKYIVTENYIQFNWGLLKKHYTTIPFENGVRISIVKYNRKRSTIFIDINESAKIKGISFKNTYNRHSPTFEHIENGNEVYELLERLRKKAS